MDSRCLVATLAMAFELCILPSLRASAPSKADASTLAYEITDLNLPPTTILKAHYQIGVASHVCMGIVVTSQSMALADTSLISQHKIRLSDALAAVLKQRTDLVFSAVDGCVVIHPIRSQPSYLSRSIQSFKTERSALDFISYRLYQTLVAAELTKKDPRNIGIVSSITSNSDSPEIGPFNVEHKTIQTILNKLALEAGSTIWIAIPKSDDEPWLFIPYSRSTSVISVQLKGIIQTLKN